MGTIMPEYQKMAENARKITVSVTLEVDAAVLSDVWSYLINEAGNSGRGYEQYILDTAAGIVAAVNEAVKEGGK